MVVHVVFILNYFKSLLNAIGSFGWRIRWAKAPMTELLTKSGRWFHSSVYPHRWHARALCGCACMAVTVASLCQYRRWRHSNKRLDSTLARWSQLGWWINDIASAWVVLVRSLIIHRRQDIGIDEGHSNFSQSVAESDNQSSYCYTASRPHLHLIHSFVNTRCVFQYNTIQYSFNKVWQNANYTIHGYKNQSVKSWG